MYGPLGIRYVGYWYKEERERGRNVWLWTCDEMSVNNNIFGIWILTIYYSKFLTGFISLILGSMKLFWKLPTTRFFTPNCCKHHGETPSISSLYLSSIFFPLLAQIPLIVGVFLHMPNQQLHFCCRLSFLATSSTSKQDTGKERFIYSTWTPNFLFSLFFFNSGQKIDNHIKVYLSTVLPVLDSLYVIFFFKKKKFS